MRQLASDRAEVFPSKGLQSPIELGPGVLDLPQQGRISREEIAPTAGDDELGVPSQPLDQGDLVFLRAYPRGLRVRLRFKSIDREAHPHDQEDSDSQET